MTHTPAHRNAHTRPAQSRGRSLSPSSHHHGRTSKSRSEALMRRKSFFETLLGERVTHLHQLTEHTQYIFACFVSDLQSLLFWSRNKIMYTNEWILLISDPTLPPRSVWKSPGPQTGLYSASQNRCDSELQKVPWWEKLPLLCNSEMTLSGSKKNG